MMIMINGKHINWQKRLGLLFALIATELILL